MWEESAPSPGPPHLLSCSQVGGHPSLYIKPHAHLLQTSDLLTLRPKGAHTDGMICPPKDGSRDENCLGSRISLRLFWQEILDYGYPESALEGMHGLLKFFFFFCLGLTDFLLVERRTATGRPEVDIHSASHGRGPCCPGPGAARFLPIPSQP